MMKQSSHGLSGLPAWVALSMAVCAVVTPVDAQERYRANRTENFRADPEPTAALLATVPAGTELPGGARRGGWVEVTLDGWIWARSVGASDRAGYDLRVAAGGGENLRATPNGPVSARLRTGTLLSEIARREGWVHVRRNGWMWRQSLAPLAGAAPAGSAAPPAAPAAAPASSQNPSLDRVVTSGAAPLFRTAGGDTLGRIAARASGRVLARSEGWVRVQFEGWLRDTDVRPAEDDVLVGVTGAEVRSRPGLFEGRLLQWRLQLISLRTADTERREMRPGTPYLLARGPLPEAGFVYVTVTEAQRAELAALPPLTELTAIGRVRVARTRYVGNPILELVDFAVTTP